MKITISGKAGSGKSTIAKLISKKLNLKHYSIGDLMRTMASEKGISLMELNKLAETDKSIDLELDKRLKKLGEEKDDFVVDGRLTAHFIPTADIKVFLSADDEVRAKRILGDKRTDESNTDLKETISNIEKREESEKKRYQQYYGVDYTNPELYNLMIDTSEITPEKIVNKISEFIESGK